MDASNMFTFSFHFFLMSYNYITLIFKHKKHSLKDLFNYEPPKGLVYSKINGLVYSKINGLVYSKIKIETS
jgi:hypothetical protein